MDAQHRRWYNCSGEPVPGRALCADHVAMARQRDRGKARRKRDKLARRANR
jgi:hypothetical protein